MPQSTTEFLLRLRKLVQDEAEAQFQELTRQWSRSLQEHVARGWAQQPSPGTGVGYLWNTTPDKM